MRGVSLANAPGSLVTAVFAALALILCCSPVWNVVAQNEDDSFETATAIQDGKQVIGHLEKGKDDMDFYKLDVQSAGIVLDTYVGNLESDVTSNDLDLCLFDSGRALIECSSTMLRYEYITWLIRSAGTYYMKVIIVTGAADYTFDAATHDPLEVTDGYTSDDNYLSYDYYEASDWYKVHLEGGGRAETVTFEMNHESGADFNLFLIELWNGRADFYDVSWLGVDGVEDRERVTATASYSGYYYLRVKAYSGWGHYSLVCSMGTAVTDDDNAPGRAGHLEFNATVHGRVDQSSDHYDFLSLDASAGETVTLDMTIQNGWDDIFSLMILDEGLDVVIDRTNYIFEPAHGTVDEIVYGMELGAGRFYIAISARVALVPGNPDDLSDGNAAGDYRLVVNMSHHAPDPVNVPPVSNGNITATIDEDTVWTRDLSELFSDPDGDPLHYTAVAGRVKVTIDADGMLTATPPADWSGEDVITITAKDPLDGSAQAVVTLTVRQMPELPVLDKADPSPGANVVIEEGESVTLQAWVKDGDSQILNVHWEMGGAVLSGTEAVLTPLGGLFSSTHEYVADHSSAGLHIIELYISDGDGDITVSWNIQVKDVNRAPVIEALTPANGSVYSEGETVSFNVIASDADGDDLSFTWREGKTVLHSGDDAAPGFQMELAVGRHDVDIVVTDGNDTAMATVTIEIKEQGGGVQDIMGYIIAGLIVAIVLIFIIYAYASGSSRRRLDDLEDLEDDLDQEERRMRRAKERKKRPKARKKKGRKARKRGN